MNINLKLAITKSEDMGVALNLRLTTPILLIVLPGNMGHYTLSNSVAAKPRAQKQYDFPNLMIKHKSYATPQLF